MQRVAAEVAQEVAVLLVHGHLDACTREEEAEHHAGGPAPGNGDAGAQLRASAALTYSGLSGTRRMRTPVASKNAFATAAGMTRIDGSPAPLGAISGRLMSVTSIDSGASAISRIG